MLPYQHLILMRFSLAFTTKNMKPASKILSEKKLKQRFFLFERICLPSLLKQSLKTNVLVIIKITSNLPEKWKNRLYNLAKPYPNYIKIQEFPHNQGSYGNSLHSKHIKEFIKPETKIIATTRLDDDDALAPYFTKIVRKYINRKYINKIISFPRGYVLNTKSKRYFLAKSPLIALGLTLIQNANNYIKFHNNIYSCCHTQWHKRTKCYYPKHIMYIRTRHGVNDSGMSRITRNRLRNGKKNVRLLRKRFPGIKI